MLAQSIKAYSWTFAFQTLKKKNFKNFGTLAGQVN